MAAKKTAKVPQKPKAKAPAKKVAVKAPKRPGKSADRKSD